MINGYRIIYAAFILGFAVHLIFAQQVSVDVQPAPHYAGEPVMIRVNAHEFNDEPQPVCILPEMPAGINASQPAVNTSVSSFTQVINGKVTSRREVSFVFTIHITADSPGVYQLPPITVRQNGTDAKTPPLSIRFEEMETNDSMRIELILPDQPVYTGQYAEVAIQWWYAGDLDQAANLIIRCPMFDQFNFIDQPVDQRSFAIPVMTAEGELHIPAQTEHRTLDGKDYLVVTAKRKMIADQHGIFELPPTSASIEQVTRWRRGFFGSREPVASEKIRAIDKTRKFVVEPIPLDQAPPDFAGAVGRGFAIDVQADRTVVHAGDPITLRITVRGDGNLERAGLPVLTDGAGLDPAEFRTTDEQPPGIIENNAKTFEVTVRVLTDQVDELPPLSYSWFEPDRRKFMSVKAEPIALRVMPAQLVSAEDVLTAAENEHTPGTDITVTRTEERSGTQHDSQNADNMAGADLAIIQNLDALLVDESRKYGGITLHASAYALGTVVMIAAFIWRKYAEIDPEVIRLRKLIQRQYNVVRNAKNQNAELAAKQIADAMRRLLQESSGKTHTEIDRVIAICDTIAFAPGDSLGNTIDPEICQQAQELIQRVAKEATV